MSKSDTYVKRTEEFLTKLQETMPFELVDVEFVKEAGEYYLRAYCDKEGVSESMTVQILAEP